MDFSFNKKYNASKQYMFVAFRLLISTKYEELGLKPFTPSIKYPSDLMLSLFLATNVLC